MGYGVKKIKAWINTKWDSIIIIDDFMFLEPENVVSKHRNI